MFETHEWSTERAIVVRVPPSVAFALVRDHRRLPEWAPGLARVEVDDAAATFPGGPGTVRTLIPRIGRAGTEVVHALDEEALELSYGATDAALGGLCRDHRAVLRCEPEGDGTRITFAVQIRSAGSALRFLVARAMFDVAVRASLHGLAARLRPRR